MKGNKENPEGNGASKQISKLAQIKKNISEGVIIPYNKRSGTIVQNFGYKEYKLLEEAHLSSVYSSSFISDFSLNDNKYSKLKEIINKSSHNTLIESRAKQMSSIRLSIIDVIDDLLDYQLSSNRTYFLSIRILDLYMIDLMLKQDISLSFSKDLFLAISFTIFNISSKFEDKSPLPFSLISDYFFKNNQYNLSSMINKLELDILDQVGIENLIYRSPYDNILLYFQDFKLSNLTQYEKYFLISNNDIFQVFISKAIFLLKKSMCIIELRLYTSLEVSIALIYYCLFEDFIIKYYNTDQILFINSWVEFIYNQSMSSLNANQVNINQCVELLKENLPLCCK